MILPCGIGSSNECEITSVSLTCDIFISSRVADEGEWWGRECQRGPWYCFQSFQCIQPACMEKVWKGPSLEVWVPQLWPEFLTAILFLCVIFFRENAKNVGSCFGAREFGHPLLTFRSPDSPDQNPGSDPEVCVRRL